MNSGKKTKRIDIDQKVRNTPGLTNIQRKT